MRRREVITLLGGAAAAWPFMASAQQPAMPVIGVLTTRALGDDPHLLAAFRQGLRETGYAERENVAIEYRFAENQYERLPAMAADLVQRQVNVIAAFGANAAFAAKAATSTIPVVFLTGGDPIRLGLVAHLNRPGGNLTGVTQLSMEAGPKRLELVHEMVPSAKIVALLVNPTNPISETVSRDTEAAARTLGLQLHVLPSSTESDLTAAFTTLPQLRAGALVIGPDAFFNNRSERIAALTLRHAMPAIYQYREFAAAGGLMSYGGSLTDVHRLVGAYTGRIVKGEKPADLPVQQGTKVELIINLKTAKALGLDVPLSLLGRADEVIE